VPLGGAIDLEEERSRIEKKVDDLEKYLIGIDKKLGNKGFIKKAPKEVVQKEEEKRKKFEDQLKTLNDNLHALK